MAGLIVVAIAQIADLVTFFAATAVAPISGEGNGIARLLYAADPYAVAAFKLGLLTLSLALMARFARAPVWVRVAAVSIPAGLGLAGAAANLVTLILILRPA